MSATSKRQGWGTFIQLTDGKHPWLVCRLQCVFHVPVREHCNISARRKLQEKGVQRRLRGVLFSRVYTSGPGADEAEQTDNPEARLLPAAENTASLIKTRWNQAKHVETWTDLSLFFPSLLTFYFFLSWVSSTFAAYWQHCLILQSHAPPRSP